MPKHIFLSKTFWVNTLSTILMYTDVIPVNKYSILVLGIINLVLRFLTNQPITVVPKAF